MFSDVFVISYDDGYGIVGSIIYILLYKLLIRYVVILFELEVIWISQVVVLVIEDNFMILIIFKMKRNVFFIIEGKIFYSGDMFNFLFNCFEMYQIVYSIDLMGILIELLVLIVVFFGNDCVNFGGLGVCDYFIE